MPFSPSLPRPTAYLATLFSKGRSMLSSPHSPPQPWVLVLPALVLVGVLALLPGQADAQSTPAAEEHTLSDEEIANLQKDIASLRAGQVQLRRDIRRLEDLLRELAEGMKTGNIELAPAEPALDVRLNVSGEYFLGRADAPITLFELSDYE